MLNSIIQFSVRNKLLIGLMTLGLIIWGSIAVTKLPIDAVPDITNNQVMIITSAPSLGAPDVERFITVPLEQATRNVPGIIEQRSFSRFGLSLVTIVFDDKTDVYWARQQVSERMVQAQQQIPAGIGAPELGPVTTGLGEVFQYVVKTKPGYESKYSLTELRTIQDWIVRRQLLGTPGVADVSSFGGLLKQFEVAVNTDKLRSFNITISDVFDAVQRNNQNTGGAYIEKGPNVLFIRSEGLVKSLDDIGAIVVKKLDSGIPVLVRDVATVQIGSAIRYGATVYNDQGEVAGAVVMMLKGANSNVVIQDIKSKIAKISESLPEGVVIEPFLDRTKMVNNAIGTVEQNLIEGALIVVFVLVLFLGNLRAGLLVASVIPLSMLFAIIMMNLFGVSGNLMSLGALDFGLLVDGAVIIVEAVMHKLSHHSGFKESTKLNQHQMDTEVETASKKMMNAAVFGQIIILIVYLPILTLQGIEGKMFRPMAQTVSFAILGAFLLSLTYIPMVSTLMLSKKISHHPTISDKMMKVLQAWYKPSLQWVLRFPKWVVGASAIAFILSVLVLTTLGGEFIPKLEEGDFAVDTRLLTGSSLSSTVSTTQKTAKVLLQRFPEVEKVVTKIGAGEIPTDPMPLEAADMMVILKDKKQWTSAKTFDELAEKMSEALQDVPGVATGFQFPVQMRFNELMTGARQDVVCKIFGEDLDSLARHAAELGEIIKKIEGAKDLYIETVTGVPQMVITYNREAIARYGADVEEINRVIRAAYAGAEAGLVFEGDRRFALSVKLDKGIRQDLDNIGNQMIGVRGGEQVPLHVLANVSLQDGPYQIQREDAQRRITVGFNVRGRDVQSIVNELQQKVSAKIELPAGYYITYGGAYENLLHATKRLSIAVPIALLLILMMLYFAFNQLKYSLLIFSAIPLSAIGGVLALWIRDMPFSISAGVGFIALFGVAVLNGIVLITEMNRLKADGVADIKSIIMQATQIRLRPVLMTAAVASLGFLPMAISSGAGAEVQRPLATVVIGGLISATFLTLLVLPCLYFLFEHIKPRKKKHHVVAVVFLLFASVTAQAQTLYPVKEQDLLLLAREKAMVIQQQLLQEQFASAMLGTARDIPKTQVLTELGNYNSISFDGKLSLIQNFASPGYYRDRRVLLETYVQRAKQYTILQQTDLDKLMRELYLDMQYLQLRKLVLMQMDSVYSGYVQKAALRYEKGETNLLEKVSLENYARQTKLMLGNLDQDVKAVQQQLSILLQTEHAWLPADPLSPGKRLFDTALIRQHPLLGVYQSQIVSAKAETDVEKSRMAPEWQVGYNNQSLIGWQTKKDKTESYADFGRRFSSLTAGLTVPLFNQAGKSRVAAAKINEAITSTHAGIVLQDLQSKLAIEWQSYQKHRATIQYYEQTALKQAELIIQTANLQYQNGAISYLEWGILVQQAFDIRVQYIEALRSCRMAEIMLLYLLPEKK